MKSAKYVLCLLPVLLTSCSHIPANNVIIHRDQQYLTARSIPPMRVPPGLSSDKFQNAYPVSDKTYPENQENVSIVPPGLYNNTDNT